MGSASRQSGTPSVLLVNPWIVDFAAYDLFAKPLGLLMLAGLLRQAGWRVDFIDCLDRHDPGVELHSDSLLPPTFQHHGTGKYPKTPIETPAAIRDIPRRFYRYGVHPDSLREQLAGIAPPDMVWLSCAMTYWYPGAEATIRVVREVFPGAEVWLGGLYARLCREHAQRNSGADRVVSCTAAELPDLLGCELPNRAAFADLAAAPRPAFDLVHKPDYLPLLTSLGCPYHCPYCASRRLFAKRQERAIDDVFDEISYWYTEHAIRDFAFYDDALLFDAERRLLPLLRRVIESGIEARFHTPNAVHVRALTPAVCELLNQSGFVSLRLGLETTRAEHQKSWGAKLDGHDFTQAVDNLQAAGFAAGEIGAYLLCGLPEQEPDEVAESIEQVGRLGVMPYLSEYSPIPGTETFSKIAPGPKERIATEPLLQNNSFLACRRPGFGYDELVALKNLARATRRKNRD